jgi:hypothetical protein
LESAWKDAAGSARPSAAKVWRACSSELAARSDALAAEEKAFRGAREALRDAEPNEPNEPPLSRSRVAGGESTSPNALRNRSTPRQSSSPRPPLRRAPRRRIPDR